MDTPYIKSFPKYLHLIISTNEDGRTLYYLFDPTTTPYMIIKKLDETLKEGDATNGYGFANHRSLMDSLILIGTNDILIQRKSIRDQCLNHLKQHFGQHFTEKDTGLWEFIGGELDKIDDYGPVIPHSYCNSSG